MPAWIIFSISGVVIVVAGIRLTRTGEVIADVTGLGGAWVGAVFIAIATSLPELATDIFAVRQGDNELALGDLFGSSMANMLILAVADLVLWRQRVLMRMAVNQSLIGLLAIGLTLVALAGMQAGGDVSFLGFGWAPLAIFATYLITMRQLHLQRAEPPFVAAGERILDASEAHPHLRRPVIGFVLAALVILLAAPFLARSAGDIADQLGVSSGVIGVALLAITTSLPEVTVTVESLRRGSIDMAVGNLLGSNCVNMAILLPLDAFDRDGSLLAGIGSSAALAGLFATLLMAQTLFELLNKAEARVRWMEPDAIFRIVTYGIGLFFVVNAGVQGG